jgi:hypothetical protein
MGDRKYDFMHKNRTRLLVDIKTNEGVVLRKGTRVHRVESPLTASLPYTIYCEAGTFHADDVVIEKKPGQSYIDSVIEKRVGEKYIILERGEGPRDDCDKPVVFKTFEEAKHALGFMARNAPKSGGYDKTDFIVVWHDGETYEGRVDLKREHVLGYDLREHIRDFLSFHAGIRKPPHMSQERYDEYLAAAEREEPGEKQKAAEYLGRYDI